MVKLIPAEDEIWRHDIQKFIHFIWNKEELSDVWKESIILLI
jgi:hypothetical protein